MDDWYTLALLLVGARECEYAVCIPYDQALFARINNSTLPSEALIISVLDDHALTTGVQ